MTITSIAAAFIRSLRPEQLSWIHVFVPITLFGVATAIWRVRRHDIQGHRAAMLGVYFGGLVIAGALTFYPGRLMYRLFVRLSGPATGTGAQDTAQCKNVLR